MDADRSWSLAANMEAKALYDFATGPCPMWLEKKCICCSHAISSNDSYIAYPDGSFRCHWCGLSARKENFTLHVPHWYARHLFEQVGHSFQREEMDDLPDLEDPPGEFKD